MDHLSSIQNGLVQIVNSALSKSQGDFTHTGDYSITGDVSVSGAITVDTLNVKNLVAENNSAADASAGSWTVPNESGLNGKGLTWNWELGSTQLIYRLGGRIWTNGVYDLPATSSYNIDNIPVITATGLGTGIKSSNLTQIGRLETLAVSGDATLSEFAFFNSTSNRLGLGTDQPSASIEVLDNNVSITIGSPSTSLATIGTASNHDLAIITDNIPRIVVKQSGEVNLKGDLNVSGTINATSIVTDSRIDRSHPIQFLATKDSSIYGLGLNWAGTGNMRQLIMLADPDRLYTSEDFEAKSYLVGGKSVLTGTGLGESVISSNLTQLGTLEALTVNGPAKFSNIDSPVVDFGAMNITGSVLTAKTSVAVKLNETEVVYGDANQINIGDKLVQTKPVKVFGKLSVGINNPDPTLNFSVGGDVNIGNKRFTNNSSMPTSGSYEIGDICWNTNPMPNSYVGWVCIAPGNPGTWLPFGEIKAQ
jgi:hypothetical protein